MTGPSLGERIAETLKEQRARRGLTLRALAAASGVSAAMISEIERGAKSPTISVLSAIAHALDMPLSHLVDGGVTPSRLTLMRADEHLVIDEGNGVVRTHLGPTLHSSRIEFVRIDLPPGAQTGVFAPHSAESVERMHVDRGSVELRIGDDRARLDDGDSLVFAGDRPHSLRNVGTVAAVLYVAIEG